MMKRKSRIKVISKRGLVMGWESILKNVSRKTTLEFLFERIASQVTLQA